MSFDADLFYVKENRALIQGINYAAKKLDAFVRQQMQEHTPRRGYYSFRKAFTVGTEYARDLLSQTNHLEHATPAQVRKALAFFDRTSGAPIHFMRGAEHISPLVPNQGFEKTKQTLDFVLQKPWSPEGYHSGAETQPDDIAQFLTLFPDAAQRVYEHLAHYRT